MILYMKYVISVIIFLKIFIRRLGVGEGGGGLGVKKICLGKWNVVENKYLYK